MTHPPEDPGYRPPPPPHGEPRHQGGGYQPPPWQPGGQDGYAPPPGPPAPPPGYAPRTGKGFFAALFDLNFDYMVTTKVIKIFYVLIILVDTLIALFDLVLAWSFFAWNQALGFVTLLATPVLWLFGILLSRMFLEYLINQFKITEHLKAMREREELR